MVILLGMPALAQDQPGHSIASRNSGRGQTVSLSYPSLVQEIAPERLVTLARTFSIQLFSSVLDCLRIGLETNCGPLEEVAGAAVGHALRPSGRA